jgi:hypothetical protein
MAAKFDCDIGVLDRREPSRFSPAPTGRRLLQNRWATAQQNSRLKKRKRRPWAPFSSCQRDDQGDGSSVAARVDTVACPARVG